MPAITLYGRRWHFSSDIIPLPAALGAFYSFAWILVMILFISIRAKWPQHCDSTDGVQYIILLASMFCSFVVCFGVELLLVYHGLQGAPFEESKRRRVPILLYVGTAPLLVQLAMAVYGSYVTTELDPDCWEQDVRGQITTFSQALVFVTWAFMFVATVGLLIVYNMYPDVGEMGSWEGRCRCIATMLCCHHQVVRRPDGKRPPIQNIAELTAGLLSHVDLDATDLTAALMLTSAAQNRRRRMRVVKALLPVYRELRRAVDEREELAAEEGASLGGCAATASSAADDGSDGFSSCGDSVYEVPSDTELTHMLTIRRQQGSQLGDEHGAEGAAVPPAGTAPLTEVGPPAPQEPPVGRGPKGGVLGEEGGGGGGKRGPLGVGWGHTAARGKRVTWQVQDKVERGVERAGEAEAASLDSKPHTAAGGPPAKEGWVVVAAHGGGAGRDGAEGEGRGNDEGVAAGGAEGRDVVSDVEGVLEPATAVPTAGSLPLTEHNVAALTAVQQLATRDADERVQLAAELVAGDALQELPEHVPQEGTDIMEQLANALETEIAELGGDEMAEEDLAVVADYRKQQSLDMSNIQLDPEQPTIWFPPSEPSRSAPSPSTLDDLSDADSLNSAAHPPRQQHGVPASPNAPSQQQPPPPQHGPQPASSPFAASGECSHPGTRVKSVTKPRNGLPKSASLAAAPPAGLSTEGPPPPAGAAPAPPIGAAGDEEVFEDAASWLPSVSSGGTLYRTASSSMGSSALTPPVHACSVTEPGGQSGTHPGGTEVGVTRPEVSEPHPVERGGGGGPEEDQGRIAAADHAIAAVEGAQREGGVPLVEGGTRAGRKARESGQAGAGSAAGGPREESVGGEEGSSAAVELGVAIEVAAAAAMAAPGSTPPAGRGQHPSPTPSTPNKQPEGVGVGVSTGGARHAVVEGGSAGLAAHGGREGEGRGGENAAAPEDSDEGWGSEEGFPLEHQISLHYPVVITPSEHVHEFRGPLPADALADIYAGRHEKVPSPVVREALSLLKYSYAVYYMKPSFDQPASCMDMVCCCRGVPDPQEVVFRGLNELEALQEEEGVELLHLNCSNRVLAHLPYMIALDHTRKAVVLAIRGTISVADVVTDAVVYPEPLDEWIPEDVKQEIEGPVFAHAGMVAAARAIFQDMTEREILPPLMHQEQGGFVTPPQQQDMAEGRGVSGRGGGERRNGRDRAQEGWEGQYDAEGGRGEEEGVGYPSSNGAAGSSRGQKMESQRGREEGGRETSPRALGRHSGGGEGPGGRLWEGGSQGAAVPDAEGDSAGAAGAAGAAGSAGGGKEGGPCSARTGREVGSLMRRMIEKEGWEFIVQGHSLGAGAAALVSLKLREHYPGLKCIAYSVPGGLVSKNLAHAMARFTTSVLVGKDAVPRMSVSTLGRLMDEMVTALARCKQPKVKVLFYPWWRRNKRRFREMFHTYREVPREAMEVLRRYYDSRNRMGQPLSMYPPGRLIFLRPIKTRRHKLWDAVWIAPEDILGEGILVSPNMLTDHLCSTAHEALTAAAKRSENMEAGVTVVQGEATARKMPARIWPVRLGKRKGRGVLGSREGRGHQKRNSLTQVLIDDSM